MTTPNDSALLELVSAFERVLQTLAGSVQAVRTLADAHEAGQRPTDQELLDYRTQCDVVEHSIVELRAMLAKFKSQIPVH